MPRNLMISGHLRFSFFSRCGTFVQRRSKENEIQAHSRQSLALYKKYNSNAAFLHLIFTFTLSNGKI